MLSAGAAFAQGLPSQPDVNPGAMTSAMAESLQFYKQMHAVLSHPRCVNCHPKDDTPKQGLDGHVHSPPITRGPQDSGPPGLACMACHNDANFDPGRMRGAPDWHLAPAPMAWGWEPGIDVYGKPREPVPLPKAEFDRVVVAWAKTGGACPD